MRDQGGEEHQLRCSSCLQHALPRASLSFRSVSASKLAKVSENAQSARNLSRSCATRVSSWPQPPRPRAPQPRGRGCRLHGLSTGTPLQARACSGSRWKAHPGSGFSKHTFVQRHPEEYPIIPSDLFLRKVEQSCKNTNGRKEGRERWRKEWRKEEKGRYISKQIQEARKTYHPHRLFIIKSLDEDSQN
ncbi:hypothetical protein R6Z07F_014637 [Ovis aries]